MKVPLLKFVGGPVVPLLNFEGVPGILLLNFRRVPGPTLNFEGGPGSRVPGPGSQGPEVPGPGVLVPLLHYAIQEHIHQKDLNLCLLFYFYGKVTIELEKTQTTNSAVL